MSKDPAVLFYTSDFITGTISMTDEQRGKYILLLCLQHQKGMLSENDMMNICKTYDKDIFAKFIKTPDGFYNERMKLESDKRKTYADSRRNNRLSKKDEDSTTKESSNISKSYVKHMENENENYKYSKFYDSEIENSAGKSEEINFIKYIKKIYGEIGVYGRMDKILKLQDQLTYDQFIIVLKKAESININLMEMLEKFDNYNGKYKPKTVYRSLLNWLDYEIARRKK